MRVRLIDGLNCTPMVFREKPPSRKLTVPVLETVGAHEVRDCAELAQRPAGPGQASQAHNAHTQLMDLGINPEILAKFSMCMAFQSIS